MSWRERTMEVISAFLAALVFGMLSYLCFRALTKRRNKELQRLGKLTPEQEAEIIEDWEVRLGVMFGLFCAVSLVLFFLHLFGAL